jgi:glutathione peroxidase
MYNRISLIILAFLSVFNLANSNTNESVIQSIYQIPLRNIDGDEVYLEKYKGKKVLIVNVASKCGFTKQYEDLQKLWEKYEDKLVVLGFPSNDFASQEPGTDAEIKQFCTITFGVNFPMFSKVSVKGTDQHPLYRWLSNPVQNGWNKKSPSWNFSKYLLDEDGKLIGYWGPMTKPFSKKILKHLN